MAFFERPFRTPSSNASFEGPARPRQASSTNDTHAGSNCHFKHSISPGQAGAAISSILDARGQARAAISRTPADLEQSRAAISSTPAAQGQARMAISNILRPRGTLTPPFRAFCDSGAGSSGHTKQIYISRTKLAQAQRKLGKTLDMGEIKISISKQKAWFCTVKQWI